MEGLFLWKTREVDRKDRPVRNVAKDNSKASSVLVLAKKEKKFPKIPVPLEMTAPHWPTLLLVAEAEEAGNAARRSLASYGAAEGTRWPPHRRTVGSGPTRIGNWKSFWKVGTRHGNTRGGRV